MNFPLVVAICGPTATGKTAVALELAKYFETEIINFDSIQVFRELDIGSSKPSRAILNQVPHHLIDIVEPTETFTAGDFKRSAENLVKGKLRAKKTVVLVGGTGFYLQALMKGMYELDPVNPLIKEEIKNQLLKHGKEVLYRELQSIDPAYAQSISLNDSYRIQRGLEVWRAFKKTPSEIRREFQKTAPPFKFLQLGLAKERAKLKQDIQFRSEQMIKGGLLDEVEGLLKKYGSAANLKPLRSVGYKDTVDVLEGRAPRESLSEAITRSTMALAKRQMTWFKRDGLHWYDGSGDLKRLVSQMAEHVKNNL